MRLISRNQRYAIATVASPWPEILELQYTDDTNICKCMVDNFAIRESLFPLIRRVEKDMQSNPDSWDDILTIVSAIITDRGFLAGQTRETFTTEGSQSRVTTALSYIPTIKGKNLHIKCKEAALRQYRKLWQAEFPDNDHYDCFDTLLDRIWEDCEASRKAISKTVHFPDRSVTGRNIQPFEIRAYNESTIIFNAGNEPIYLRDYLSELTVNNGMDTFTTEEWIFFINYVLWLYYVKDSALRSITPGKEYHPVIAKCDEALFPSQVGEHRNLNMMMQVALTAQNPKRRKPDCGLNRRELINALMEHDKVCGSCMVDYKDASDMEDHYNRFVENIQGCWDILYNQPYIIYKLWNSRVQKPIANSSEKIYPKKLGRHIRRALQEKSKITSEKEKEANSELFLKLIHLCFPNMDAQQNSWYRDFAFDRLENQNSKDSFFTAFETMVSQDKNSCLSFSPTCLTENAVGLIKPPKGLPVQSNDNDKAVIWEQWEQFFKDSPHIVQELKDRQPELSAALAGQIILERWLESNPEIIKELRDELPKRKGHKGLCSRFCNYFEDPSEHFFNKWEIARDSVLNDIQWDSLSHDMPELISSSKAAVDALRQLLIAWTILQLEVEKHKKKLVNIVKVIFASLFDETEKNTTNISEP